MAWWRRRKKQEPEPTSDSTYKHATYEDVDYAIRTSPPRVRYGVYSQHAIVGMTVQEVYDSLCTSWRIPDNVEPYVYENNYGRPQYPHSARALPNLVDANHILKHGELLEFHRPMGPSKTTLRRPEHKPITPTATMMGYVYGFRVYALQPSHDAEFVRRDPTEIAWTLFGGWGNPWHKPHLKAVCQENRYSRETLDHAPHHHPHRCGVNMYNLEATKPRDLMSRIHRPHNTISIVSLTKAWGTIIEHELGYRVEHAEVIGLMRYESMPKLKISGFQQVPQLLPDAFNRMVESVRGKQLVRIPDEEA